MEEEALGSVWFFVDSERRGPKLVKGKMEGHHGRGVEEVRLIVLDSLPVPERSTLPIRPL